MIGASKRRGGTKTDKQPVNIQSKVAAFIAGLTYDALPAPVVNDAKYRVLDWLGCVLAGVGSEPSKMITGLVQDNGGSEQATVLGTGLKVPVSQAVLANGVTGHIVEFDDGHRQAIGHPGSVAVPTALALAEYLGRSGKELLTAVVAGYEVFIRLGMAVNPSHYQIWHTTGTCGVFAAAAAAAALLRLDPQRTQMTLGIAGTMAAGLQETFGTYAKPLNVGHACSCGVQAALLAQAGFTGPDDIILGKKGFVAATSSAHDVTPLAEIDSGHFLATTAFYKMYSSCGHTHSPLDAIFAIMNEHPIAWREVEKILVRTYRVSVELTGQLKTGNEGEAKFSLPYCLAVALVDKSVTLAEFTAEKLQNPQIIELAKKISVIEDPAATAIFPKRQADIRIELSNGRVIERKVAGADDTPRYDAIADKFLALAKLRVAEQQAEQLRNEVLNLDKLSGVESLLRCMA